MTIPTRRLQRFLLITALPVLTLLLAYCSSPETVVVDREPEAGTKQTSDTAAAQTEDNFKHLRIGTVYPIHSLDPLFSHNPAELRSIQALYETLVSYNEEGKLVPELASEWKVGSDSLTYTFQLRSDIYYHDSPAFANGIGRRLVATDVAYVFRRMARPGVPEKAANMFSSIKGFEPYFTEQHKVNLPKLRELQGIEGIDVMNENTIRFELNQKDSLFLHKLATPYASVYPMEAVKNTENGLHNAAVGTGPYQYTEIPGDTSLIMERFDDYVYKQSEQSTPLLDRIDVHHFSSSRNLLQYVANGDIDLVHELSPELHNMLMDSTGQPNDLNFEYNLVETDARKVYSIYKNENARAPLNDDQAAYLAQLTGRRFSNMVTPTSKLFSLQHQVEPTTLSSNPPKLPKSTYGSFSDDPVIKLYYRSLATELDNSGRSTFSVVKIRVPTTDIQIYGKQNFQIHSTGNRGETAATNPPDNLLHRFSIDHYVLSTPEVKNLYYNELPWWVDYSRLNISTN